MKRRLSTRRAQRNRSGAAAVEFAMTAPLLFLLLLGALELGHANMIFNAAEAAAYEGAREGIVPGATSAESVAAANSLLQVSGVEGATVTTVPANFDTDSDQIEVRVVVPYNENALMAPFFTRGLRIDRQCTLQREKL